MLGSIGGGILISIGGGVYGIVMVGGCVRGGLMIMLIIGFVIILGGGVYMICECGGGVL